MSGFPKWDMNLLPDDSPRWAIPKNSKTVKYHCFDDNESLCGRHVGYKKDTIEHSGFAYDCPMLICKVCYNKWRKEFRTEDNI